MKARDKIIEVSKALKEAGIDVDIVEDGTTYGS